MTWLESATCQHSEQECISLLQCRSGVSLIVDQQDTCSTTHLLRAFGHCALKDVVWQGLGVYLAPESYRFHLLLSITAKTLHCQENASPLNIVNAMSTQDKVRQGDFRACCEQEGVLHTYSVAPVFWMVQCALWDSMYSLKMPDFQHANGKAAETKATT